MTAPKRLVRPVGWTQKPNRSNQYPVAAFEARVTLNETMPRGLKFRICVFPNHPNSATFQMEVDKPGTRTCIPLYRLEWGAISGHGNGMGDHIPEDLRGAVFSPGETHEHSCLYHVSVDGRRILKGGVHAARRIEPDFTTYEGAMRHACGTLSILNPEVVPPSGVQWPLFREP